MEEKIAELLTWAASSNGLENLWGDGLREDITAFLQQGMSMEEVKQQLKFLDKEFE